MNSDLESKIIIHFFDCTCNDHDVTKLAQKLNVSQPTLSKHVSKLLLAKVLNVKSHGKNRYYFINDHFKAQWSTILLPIVQLAEN